MIANVNKILFGGDYNPEQWPEDIWSEDMRLFHKAHVNVVTLNVFSWAQLQPSEESYDFTKLDKIMEMVRSNGLNVVMATSTAAHPAWMSKRYPDTMKVDIEGKKRHFGGRQNICPNSPTFRKYAPKLAEKIAKRYKDYKNIVAWHISNEYGGYCYCENCTKKFQEWAKKRYKTIEQLNNAWNTSFWGHTFYDWDEIVLPDFRSEEFLFGGPLGPIKSTFQGISLDYRRFMDDSTLECYNLEKKAVKQYTPNIPVTTNFMGNYNEFDYTKWAEDMDFISWDNYPSYDQEEADTAFWHDLMRGIKGGQSFSLIEQTPGVSNWHPYCALKRPGILRLWSYQAMAHGADTVMFFQLRRSVGACEKYHSALIDHVGTENTRVFREMTMLGEELEKLGDLTIGAETKAEVAMVFDFHNWWATSLSAGPSKDIDYLKEIHTWYRFFYDRHIPIDVISTKDNFEKYKVILAPMLYMTENTFDQKLRQYVKNGGNFITSYFSGYVDENDKVYLGGYPAKWRDILGIWVEESDALIPGGINHFSYQDKQHICEILCDLIHLEGAQSLAEYQEDFYKGMPVVTKNAFEKGKAYYVGTRSDDTFYDTFLMDICKENAIRPITEAPSCVEVSERNNQNGTFLYMMNHSDSSERVTIPYDCMDILKEIACVKGEMIDMESKDVRVFRKGK